ncbi:response regulator [Erwiniaceae bacterium BAC15a-03b]|uniref:Transcriptional regulatory protein n=1 Tax=Winslowiella arboricola TaxID=2978220 RepID=A0A9J6PQ83_9GAMM|nr:response regulator [Winslowiella arboricola]MCU5774339.1 response regulator [Winslowiella arboricola]MCU5778886.1 response regulator [Winslowiella arboricola]
MQPEIIDVLIVEDESQLARLHADLVENHPWLRLSGVASTLSEARRMLEEKRPQLVLLDNFLPDGQGITLIESELIKSLKCSVIFITAASDMHTCSQAIRCGAFDYILKPVSWRRLQHSLARFVEFTKTQRTWKVVDQQNVDNLYKLQATGMGQDGGSKGIEHKTLERIEQFFTLNDQRCYSIDDVVAETGLSKTTTRRYLEHCVDKGVLSVEMLYGKVGHPRRLYRRNSGAA